MTAAWQFLVPQAIMLGVGTVMAGAQIGFAATRNHQPRGPPVGGAPAQPTLTAKQVVPALGAAVEEAEETLGTGEATSGTFDFTPGNDKDHVQAKNKTAHKASGAVPVELYVDGLPDKANRGPACKDNPGCESLDGNCCPTWDGLNLGCCFTWQSPVPPTPDYVTVPDSQVPGPGGPYRHATMRDPFSGVLKAETMQPIYLLPVTNGLKQLVVFFVFGFDLKFKPKTGKWQAKLMKWLVSSLSRVAIIGLAVNAWRHDITKFVSKDEQQSSHYNEVMILMAVWCISPNFTMGLGIWNQLRLQSPGAVFRDDIVETQYHTLWAPLHPYRDVRFPLCPGGARWLTISKQVYALVLLPYVMPVMLLEWLMTILFCYWIIFKSKLLCLFKCIQVHVITLLCCFLWLVTLGHSGTEKIEKYWTTLWPFVYMYLVYIFASFVVPLMMAVLYGILISAQWSQISKGIGCMKRSTRDSPGQLHASVRGCMRFCSDSDGAEDNCWGHAKLARLEDWYAFIMPHRELQLEDVDRDLLIRLDVNRLSKDFKFADDTLASGAIDKLRQRLRKLRLQMEGRYMEVDSDGMSDNEESGGFGRGIFDVLVGEETCQDGDINVEKDPALLEDLENKVEYNLDDSEVQIVMLTVKSLAEVAVVQALTIFLVRTLTGENFSDFVNAMHITIQERHVIDWLHHLARLGEEKIGQALYWQAVMGTRHRLAQSLPLKLHDGLRHRQASTLLRVNGGRYFNHYVNVFDSIAGFPTARNSNSTADLCL